ncbi:MAG: 1-deoxy-D-xylulose-5-phosphate synthase [Deltaproteobacteria bacterium]|nr:1-deoxy-D-xylulose-5-phosphate synthase [Deltaproteobacteria bacterium]
MEKEKTTEDGTTCLLKQIDSPADLKQLPEHKLAQLAEELRASILDTVSQTGGHLASSLGAVELTVALHYVFDTPKDKIIWDVGHQSYAHKLLTGRRDAFPTLRQHHGISGFPRRAESLYDVFDVGHSGTSISAAVGMAEAQTLKGDLEQDIVVVIGDASITTGLAFEGLNHAGDLGSRVIVVLNDNEMSISPSVGAVAAYLSRIITGKAYNRLHTQLMDFLKTIPSIGPTLFRVVKQAEESFKGLIVPGLLFEELGFSYVGPIPGHNLKNLVENLRNIKSLKKRPILLHVITTKGKGYQPAEKDPETYHGVGPFNKETGQQHKGESALPTYTDVFGNTMIELARQDERVLAITAGMTTGTGLSKFRELFPNRFYDVGIAEEHAVTFSAGLAAEGLRPVTAIYSTFLQRAYDQIVEDVCLQNHRVVFALDRAGIVGEDGPTHHGLYDLSFLRHLPNMVVMAPKDENELRMMLKTALELDAPATIRYPRGAGEGVAIESVIRSIPVGKAEILVEGADVAILAIGNAVSPALAAAQVLKEKGVQATVVNARFVKPLDEELICSLAQTVGKIVTVEENVLSGGFGSAVLEALEKHCVERVAARRLGIPDQFVEHGEPSLLRKKYGLDRNGIVEAALSLVTSRLPKKAWRTLARAR